MERTITSLLGSRMEATDGEIGKVDDFYFDDESWTIRYLVLKTETWLLGRKVLISPVAFIKDRCIPGVFEVNLTREQVRNSPGIDTDKPVSRQQEIELYGHYAWQGYWESGFYAGGLGSTVDALPENGKKRVGADLHLRSTGYVHGFHVHGTDGEVGHVYDFIVDDQAWKLLYLVLDTHNWREGKKMLVSTAHIVQMQWSDAEVYLDETIADIGRGVVFEPAASTDPPTAS